MQKRIYINKGFTLIELLLVIAILAIIAGSVLVAFNPVKRINQSNDARRWTDVKSIASAVGAYSADHKGEVPDCQGVGDIPADGIYRCIGNGVGAQTDYGSEEAISWWDLEESAGDRIDGNGLNALHVPLTGVVGNNSDSTQGDASAYFSSAALNYLYRNDAELAGNFPGKSGVDDYKMTVSAWVKFDENLAVNTSMGIAGKHSSGDNGWRLMMQSPAPFGSGNKIALYIANFNYITDVSLEKDLWHHIAFTHDGSQIRIYHNGTIVHEAPAVSTMSNGAPFSVGFLDDPMNGLIDEVAIFDKAMTEDEVRDILFYGLQGNNDCCDLSSDLAPYLSSMPEDPVGANGQASIGYVIRRDPSGVIWVRAPYQSIEVNGLIELSN